MLDVIDPLDDSDDPYVSISLFNSFFARFRPSLTFDSPHLEILLDRLNTVLANNNQ